MSSSLKPLEQFSPDFTWCFLLKGYWQFVQMVPCHWTRWLSYPYDTKIWKSSPNPRKISGWILIYSIRDSPDPRKISGWILIYSIRDSSSAKFLSNDGCRLTFDLFMARSNLYGGKCWNVIGGHPGFATELILAIFDQQVAPILPTKFQVNWPGFPIRMIFAIFDLQVTPDASYQVWPRGREE